MTDAISSAIETPSRVRPDIITDRFLETLRTHGVVEASLFGSVLRDEERPDSDVDLLVTFNRNASYGERFHLSEELGRLCGRRVDLLTDVHPAFAPYILPTLVSLPL
jgi:predicted nucleotidyltransferase